MPSSGISRLWKRNPSTSMPRLALLRSSVGRRIPRELRLAPLQLLLKVKTTPSWEFHVEHETARGSRRVPRQDLLGPVEGLDVRRRIRCEGAAESAPAQPGTSASPCQVTQGSSRPRFPAPFNGAHARGGLPPQALPAVTSMVKTRSSLPSSGPRRRSRDSRSMPKVRRSGFMTRLITFGSTCPQRQAGSGSQGSCC